MSDGPTLETERLVLRRWQDADLEPFAALNADPEVMEHFPAAITRLQSEELVARFERQFDEHGFGLWAVEVADGAGSRVDRFVGFVGLAIPNFEAEFTPAVEVGWRLARRHWGRGYATEAANESLRFGFENAGLDEIVSFTAVVNERSQAVMGRLGMHRDFEFDHPNLPAGHPIERHVLYRLGRDDWARGRPVG